MTQSEHKDQLKHISNSKLLQELIDRKEAGIISPSLLNQFTIPELEQEILSRQKCSFGRLTCTEKAQVWMVKPHQPACSNCKQDILILSKEN